MDQILRARRREVPANKHLLTQAYNDVKHTAVNSVTVDSNAAVNFATLHRKFRIQKDRFVTWGLAWNDDEKSVDGSIDEAVVKAGLSETVGSVLNNIKEVFEQAESIATHSTTPTSKDDDKPVPTTVPFRYDEARFQDLLNDLTASVDTLYDLSRSRKALARGEHPRFKSATPSIKSTQIKRKPVGSKPTGLPKHLHKTLSYESMGTTLIDPPSVKEQPFSRPALSPYVGLPPRFETSALQIPHEGPPPYEAIGVPTFARVIAKLVRNKVATGVHEALGTDDDEVPVLIEYCDFDSTYRDTGVAPPLQRLETVAKAFRPMRSEAQTSLSLIGYFEDENQPRIGLIYDLPYTVQQMLRPHSEHPAQAPTNLKAPLSLLKLVQKDKSSSGDGNAPALEDRYRLALRLTEQLQVLHNQGVPHSNVNSSSVIFPVTATEPFASRQNQMRFPLWASFDLFSKDRVEGRHRASNLNVYKHPDNKDDTPSQDHITDIKFDMYGLALLLLEIGLWHPLSDLYKTKYTPSDFQKRLKDLWVPKLAAKCGTAYMRAVQACIQIADKPHEQQHTSVGVVYDYALHHLRQCCLISEGNGTPGDRLGSDVHTSVIQEWQSRRQHSGLSDGSSRARHRSAPTGTTRTQTETPPEIPATSFTFPQVASALSSTLTGHTDSHQLARHTSPLASLHEIKDTALEHLHIDSHLASLHSIKDTALEHLHSTLAPSRPDFTRKVRLIQRSWREHSERCKSRQRAEARTTMARAVMQQETAEPRPVRKEFSLSMPPEMMDEWHNKTMSQLSRLVERALRGSPESCSIAFTHYGETPETARPTYLVHCASTAKVKQVLRKHFKCEPCPYDVKVKKGKVRRSRRSGHPESGRRVARSMAPGVDDGAANPFYQERPLCGASIGAYKDDEHLPPVSFGGIVLVDGQPYGMSVHHMLEQDIAEEQDENEDDDSSDTSSIGSSSDNDDNVTIASEDDSTVRPLSTNSDDSIDIPVNEDTPGYLPGEIFDIEITQPALDDAISCDLHADIDNNSDSSSNSSDSSDDARSAIDSDHLLSFKLGAIHASSGLKRTTTHSTREGYSGVASALPQEVDWALFELLPPRLQPFNIIKNGARYCSNSPSPACASDTIATAILPASALPGAAVHCFGRTSGLGHGVVSPTMELVKIHGRSTFSASWTVEGDFGVGGDSGAWVLRDEDGGVAGHVLAERSGRTYICPMELLVEDMRATLGAERVGLPGADGVEQRNMREEVSSADKKAAAQKYGDGAQTEKSSSLVGAVEALSLEDLDNTDGGVALVKSPKKGKAKRCMAPASRRMIPA